MKCLAGHGLALRGKVEQRTARRGFFPLTRRRSGGGE